MALRCAAWHPHTSVVTARRVARAHAAGLRVHAWTVDGREQARALLRLGVDGLVTNHPARLRGVCA
jgi:glycerophosphoryl diester phosphodiesterase